MGVERWHLQVIDGDNASSSRDLVPADPPAPAPRLAGVDAARQQSPFAVLSGGLSLSHISPRQMAEKSLDLYAAGLISFDDYEMLAFQPELHPDYDTTVGALTGTPARPDEPRDFLAHWEERLTFERRYNPQNTLSLKRTERLLELLRMLEGLPPQLRLPVYPAAPEA